MPQMIKLSAWTKEKEAIFVNPALIVVADPKVSRTEEKYTILLMLGGSAKYWVNETAEKINELTLAAGYTTRLIKFMKEGSEAFIWINPALISGAEAAKVKPGETPFSYVAVPLPAKIRLAESPEHINNIIGFVDKKKGVSKPPDK